MNFSNNNMIIISFPRFAGGKFISNCLSLSRYCVPQKIEFAEYLLAHPDDYQYRLSAVMSSLPPQKEIKKWISHYEFSESLIYGSVWSKWSQGEWAEDVNFDIIQKLSDANLQMFLIGHGEPVNFLKIWPNARIVFLTNHRKFSEISLKLKSYSEDSLDQLAGNYCKEKYNQLSGKSWPTWEQFDSVGYNINKLDGYSKEVITEISEYYPCSTINNAMYTFNIDDCIFDKHKFSTSMSELYNQLGFDDYNQILVEKFWQSYMSLHIDNVDIM